MTSTRTAAIAKDIWPVRDVVNEFDPGRGDLGGKTVTLAFITGTTSRCPYKGRTYMQFTMSFSIISTFRWPSA